MCARAQSFRRDRSNREPHDLTYLVLDQAAHGGRKERETRRVEGSNGGEADEESDR